MKEERKERVAIDLDDVSFDMRNYLLDSINRKYGTNYTKDDISNWNAILPHKKNPIQYQAELFEHFTQPGFLENVPLVPGAKDAIEELKRRGHELFFLTSRDKKYADATQQAVKRLHPDIPVIHAPEGKHKYVKNFDVLLDDSPKELMMVGLHGGNPVAFDRPWNREVPQLIARRVSSWPEFMRLLDKKGYKQ